MNPLWSFFNSLLGKSDNDHGRIMEERSREYSTPGLQRNIFTRAAKKDQLDGFKMLKEDRDKLLDKLYPEEKNSTAELKKNCIDTENIKWFADAPIQNATIPPPVASLKDVPLVGREFGVGSKSIQRQIAKVRGYEGDPCGECQNFTLVRNGTCLKCDSCGATTGCS